MSGTVDSRILAMKIDNHSFLSGVAATINSLANLKNALNFSNSNKGLQDLQKAGSRFNLNGLGTAVDGISTKFLALSTVAITALSNITNRAVDAGLAWAKSFSVGPIMDGLHEYETNLKSIQVIQANTDRPLPEINKALQELNAYSDQTIYNFSEMAKNIGTFTAAGVELKTATSSIKGIANMAALSGSSSEQAATAMYQLSQAISSGRVGLQDWNSVVNAGMGGKKLQNALAQTAIAMGKIDSAQVKGVKSGEQLKIAGQSFRESIMAKPGQESWLTSGILVNTLATLDGRFSRAALSQELLKDGTLKYKTAAEVTAAVEKARNDLAKKGVKYTDEQFAALQKLSDASFKSATEVKTLGQVFDIAKETIGSGWSASFQSIFGNLKEAKSLFTGMSNTITGFISANALARNEVLAAWKKGGGRTNLIEGIKAGFQALFAILKPIQDAFRDIFPKKTASDLLSMTSNFRKFMESLKIGSDTAEDLKRTFRGVFAVFSILINVVKGVFGVFGDLFGVLGEGSGGFLNFTGTVGDFLVKLDQAIEKGGLLTKFFSGLSAVLSVPIRLLQSIGSFFGKMFDGFEAGSGEAAVSLLDRLGNSFRSLSGLGEMFQDMIANIQEALGPLGEEIGRALSGIGAAIADGLGNGDFSTVLDALNTGLFAGLVLLVRNFVKNGLSFDFGGGAFENIGGAFEALTGSLKSMQNQIQAKTLMLIAGAIALLTVSVVALSLIDSKNLAKALTAMSVAFGQLLGAMAILVKISGAAGFVKVPIIAASMVLMASAVVILTGAIALMGSLKWETILKGLVGVAGAIVILGAAIAVVPSKKMTLTAAGLVLVGVAVTAITAAMAVMATMSWEDIGKGLVGLAGALVAIGLALKLMGPSLILTGPGLVAVSFALAAIAGTMKLFATMSWDEIGRSMTVLAGSLIVLAVALKIMGFSALPGAAALLMVAPALLALASVMKTLGGLSWKDIGQGLTALGGALLILTVGLNAIGFGGIAGAAALLILAPALLAITSVLKTLGELSWEAIVKGLVGLAGALTVIGIAGLLMAPIIPPLIGLGIAMTTIGAGFALAGVGVLAFATAFGIFVATGAAGIAMVGGLIVLIPAFMSALAQGIVQFAVTIGKGAPRIINSFTRIFVEMLASIIRLSPMIAKALLTMLAMALRVLTNAIPMLITAGVKLIFAILNGISANIYKMTTIAVDIIVKFTTALANNMGKITRAAVNLILKFIEGLSDAINENANDLGAAGLELAMAIVNGLTGGLLNKGMDMVRDAAARLAAAIPGPIKKILGINSPSKLAHELGSSVPEGLANGIIDEASLVRSSAQTLGQTATGALREALIGLNEEMALSGDMTPVIAPVLDLSQVRKDAAGISGIFGARSVMADVSYSQAAILSADNQASKEALSDQAATSQPSILQFEQNIYTPKAPSAVDIYRQTRNQLSLAKEALNET